jgi:hypothetical protein
MINKARKAAIDNLLNFVDKLSEEKGRLGSVLQSTKDRSCECSCQVNLLKSTDMLKGHPS